MNRQRSRQADFEESYYLLLELCCSEPTIQQAFTTIQDICLAHGVTAHVKGQRLSADFQRHLDRHWVPFFGAAIRAAFMYGFVPWRKRKLASGDLVPEVLPAGTFRWFIERPGEESREKDAVLVYRVRMNAGMKSEEEGGNLHLTEWAQPNYLVNEQSVMYATVPSPMAYVIESYKHMQAAIKRQAHADAWNCTARVAVAHEPKDFNHLQHEKEVFRAFDASLPEMGAFFRHPGQHYAREDASADAKVEDAFVGRSMNHLPAVYTLPTHRHLEPTPVLQPCMDIPFLQMKYKHDVCSLIGIPPDLLYNTKAKSEGSNMTASTEKAQGFSRIFQARMQRICAFLKQLGEEAYEAIYKGQSRAEFELTPMPRLSINSIDDLKVLFECGVLQPDHTVELASILLGTTGKRARVPAEDSQDKKRAKDDEKGGKSDERGHKDGETRREERSARPKGDENGRTHKS